MIDIFVAKFNIMHWQIIVLPIIAATIGWFTNYLAVKMLFHPKEPVNLGFFKLQGIFPKRQKELGLKIGKLVSEKLFSIDDVKSKINTPEVQSTIVDVIELRIDQFIKTKLTQEMPMLAFIMNDALANKIKTTLLLEINSILPEVLEKFTDKVGDSIDIEQIVEDKVSKFSTSELENVLNSILKKEFKFIELVGAILGFLIGCIQVGITLI